MEYVFGPVPSRRLGQSLGVDTIPLKTCNWNCVYCQLGRTRPLTNQRKEYFPREEILAEVKTALITHQEKQIDWITFVGSGEPTLHSGIGWLIREVKQISHHPVAVITNGATLYLPEVREDLLPADAVMPSLDAGSAALYRKINRPHGETTFQRLVEGLEAFSADYPGKLWIEVMLVKGLNDREAALHRIAEKLESIKPDEIHLVQPTRPPVESWVEPPDQDGLLRAQAILGKAARTLHPAQGTFDLGSCDSLTDAVIAVITRHPMRESALIETLERWSPDQVREELAALRESGKAQTIVRHGTRFWSSAGAYYPQENHSERVRPHIRENDSRVE